MIKHGNNKSYYGACKKTRRTLRMVVVVVRLEEHSVSQADAGCECTEKSQHQEGAKRTMQETVREDRRVGPLRAQQFINYVLNHGNSSSTACDYEDCIMPSAAVMFVHLAVRLARALASHKHNAFTISWIRPRCNRLQQETNLALPICRA